MILTVDFETYYDKEYSLSKLTTEEYIRDDRFEVIGVGVKIDDGKAEWFSGTYRETKDFLSSFDWSKAFVLAHNCMFDSAILSWRFDIKPFGLLDTLGMARAVDGVDVSNNLAKLAERYGVGKKGNEVLLALGKHRKDFSMDEIWQYGKYCRNDVDLTYDIFNILVENFNKKELKLIDLTLRMFTEPTLELNLPLLEQHLQNVIATKEALVSKTDADRESLMSNQKFAEKLILLGVDPPMKMSPRTGKKTLALAKNDDGFKALAEHPKLEVQALVAARVGTKSTLEETRTQRFIDIAKRGSLPVPLRYYAAHTGRWGGDDKLNLQNIPRKSTLKNAIIAPKGYVIVDADSSQIEARILAWLAGQRDLVDAFEKGEDVYKIMASKIFKKSVKEINADERFIGKTVVLGSGYGLGWNKFMLHMKSAGVLIAQSEAKYIISTYREEFSAIPKLWEQGGYCLDALSSEQLKTTKFGKQEQAISLLPGIGFSLPSGLLLRYTNLRKTEISTADGPRIEYVYDTRKGVTRIYGGKVVENVCQALARCVIGEQLLKISKKYKVVLTVHDAIACIARKEEADDAVAYVEECMKWKPKWAETLPLNCEVGYGESYGET